MKRALALLVLALAPSAAAPGEHWSFTPPADPPVPRVERGDWPRSPLDRFVLAALEARGLTPAPPAGRRTLLRRATFDLTGLPPTPEEIDAFLADDSPGAFARVVDRLLASPRYGERWGRHWLDVARYADSNGLDENIAHGNAWRYRDWVIDAFNADTPYDGFVVEQLAGDLLPAPAGADSPEHAARAHAHLIATGFLSMGPKVLAEPDLTKMEMDIIDEQLDTVGHAVMGLSLGCARCHDHKYDPIPTEDYYALAGIFKSTRTMESFQRIARWHEHSLASREELERRAAHEKAIAAKKAEVKTLSEGPEKDSEETKTALERLRAELAELERTLPELPSAMGVAAGEATDLKVHVRGSHLTLGDEVKRGFPRALSGDERTLAAPERGGRLELARWITRDDHPLTSRVMVNRIWRWHFGRGIVGTPDDFGSRGERPTNPALLDWLARRFVESGWSVKAMHRRIMLSSTYRTSAAWDERNAAIDPDNRMQWRANVRRLEAEALRDSLLALSGDLDLAMGGTLLRHVKNREFLFDHTSRDATSYTSRRRSVYLPVIRNHVYDAMRLFDFPDPAVSNGDRAATTVPPQALFLLNSEAVAEATERLASRLLAGGEPDGESNGESDDDGARVRSLYVRAFGREPSAREVAEALSFVERFGRALEDAEGPEDSEDSGDARLRAWQALCQVVVASSELGYVE